MMMLTSGNIQVEKVAVKNRLNDAGQDGDKIIEILGIVTVDPVEDVESTVGAESEQIVTGDRLGLARLADHEQLWQDGHRLQVD